VVAEALVAKVIIDDETTEAIGVEWQNKAEFSFEALAKKAVILAAGAIGTPKVLMLSGIGDPYELQGINVPVKVQNREVGRSLKDHLAFYAWFMIGGHDTPLAESQKTCERKEWMNAFFNLTGPAQSGEGPVEAEARFFFACNLKRQAFDVGVEAVLLHPDFEGRVALTSRDPAVLPVAEFPALWPRDLERLEQIYERLGESLGFPDDGWVASQGHTLKESIERDAYLYQHPCCSARVARTGEPGVCDEDFQVRGVPGLYVADAAALPFLSSAHTSVPALLMGELASQSILKKGLQRRTSKRLAVVSGALSSLAARRALLEQQAAHGSMEGQELRQRPPIPTAPLSRSGDLPLNIPLLGLGTGTLPNNAGAFETSVATFLRRGGRLLDTAVMYDNAKQLQMAIASSGIPSEEVVITWKVMPFGYTYVVEQLTKALKDLGRKSLEIALLHWPGDVTNGKLRHGRPMPDCVSQVTHPETGVVMDNWQQCRLESYQALHHIQGEGYVRAVGVSNFALRHLHELEVAGFDPPAVHQTEVHPRYHDDAVVEHARQHGTQIQGYGCLGGRHTGARLLRDRVIENIAKQVGRSRAQVLLRFAVELGVVPMTAGSTEDHIDENMQIFDFNFTDIQREFLMSVAPEEMQRMYGPSPDQIL